MAERADVDKPVNPPRDALVATAINRVLQAEREAEAAIREAERLAEERLEQARSRRRALIDRAQNRITALHGRVAGRLAEIEVELRKQAETDLESVAGLRDDCIQDSIERLAEALAGRAAEGDGHGA